MNETTAAEKIAKLAEKGGTDNQKAFAEWLLETSGYKAKTANERAAFLAAAAIADRAYAVYQSAKPDSSRYVAEKPAAKKAAPKPATKPRARKAAAK